MSVPFADELSLRLDFYNDFTIIIYIYDDENVPGSGGGRAGVCGKIRGRPHPVNDD